MVNPVLTETALAVHNLGLAAGFGGTLFGKVGLDPATKVLPSLEDRGRIINSAWSRFGVVNMVGLGLASLTWVVGRMRYSGREVSLETRKWVLAKDILVGLSLATAVGNAVCGMNFAKQAPEGAVPLETGYTPAVETPKPAVGWLRATIGMGFTHMLAVAGVIGVTALLNYQAGMSKRWSFFAKALP